MKTLALVTSIVFLVGQSLFAQISDSPTNSKLKAEKFTKTLIAPKIVELSSPIMDSYEEELISELRIAKKDGDEVEAKRIEQELNEYYSINKQARVDSSKIRRWYPATDIEVIYNEENSDSGERWGDDVIVAGEPDNQKAPSMAVRHQNGDIFIAYEEHQYSSVRIYIKRSTDDGVSWSVFTGFYSSAGDDLLFPCIAIGEGNENKLFVSYYSSSEKIYVYSLDLDTGDYDFSCVQATGENIRPSITVDTDEYYYVYITWVEEDWSDLYYSRSTDYGVTFYGGVNILDGVFQNVDIGWGYDNLYITYQGNNLPGQIYLIENSPYGNPLTWPSSGSLISENQNKHLYPRIAVSDHNERACVVYTYCFSGDDHDIYYSYTIDGTSWVVDNPLEIGVEWESFSDIFYMPYSSSDDNFHLAYYDDGWINYRNTDDPSDWSGVITISDYQNASDDDFVAVSANSDNKGMVAWVAGSPGNYDVLFDSYLNVSVDPNHPDISTKFALNQNYPNPFNSVTIISFSLAKNLKDARIEIYNIKGQLIETLIDRPMPAGIHIVDWDGKDMSSGIYFCKLDTDNGSITKKMLLVK